MRAVLLYVSLCGFALGIFLRSFVEVSLTQLLVFFMASALFALWWRTSFEKLALYVSVVLLAIGLGIFRFDSASWNDTSPQLLSLIGSEIEFVGVVAKDPDVRERTTHLYLEVTNVNGVAIETDILAYAPRYVPYEYGDELRVRGVLQKPEAFETDLGRTFNYPRYLQAQGVSLVVFYPETERLSIDNKNIFVTALLSFKHKFMGSFESVVTEPQAGLGEGLLLGVKSALGEELETVFRRTGIIHIVVLSGYNVMLVVVFVMTILSYFIAQQYRLWFGVVAIICFALMVGLSATVVRASIMAVLILVARHTGRSYAVLRALFVAGAAMLVFNPYLLAFDPGFQLSFVATFGLILLAPKLEELFQRVPSVIGIREFLVATIATQIFVLPLLLYQIGEFSSVSVLVNVLVLPMVPVAMLLTFIAGMVGFISPLLALPIGFIASVSLSYILGVASWFAALPFAAFVVPPFPFWVMVVAYGGLALLMYYWLGRSEAPAEPTALDDIAITLEGWTIADAIDAKEKAELSHRDNSAETPTFFR